MADSVAGTGKINPVLCRHRLNIFMVVRIFKAGLKHVMVYVGHRFFCFYAINAHRLKLKVSHCSRRILRKRLVNSNGNFRTRNHFAADQMIFNNFLR